MAVDGVGGIGGSLLDVGGRGASNNSVQFQSDSLHPVPQPSPTNHQTDVGNSPAQSPSPQENLPNDSVPAGRGQDRMGIPNSNEGHFGAFRDNGLDLTSQNTFSRGNSVGNTGGSSSLASGFFGNGSATGPTSGIPYTTSLGGL